MHRRLAFKCVCGPSFVVVIDGRRNKALKAINSNSCISPIRSKSSTAYVGSYVFEDCCCCLCALVAGSWAAITKVE